MTWFDALLVTVMGMVAGLGMRHGAMGLCWSLFVLAAAYAANVLGAALGLWPALVLALVLGTAATLLPQALLPEGSPSGLTYAVSLQGILGLAGASVLGAVLAGAVALSFPLMPRIDAAGVHYIYPSPEVPPPLQQAVHDSALQERLHLLWDASGGGALQPLLLPDWPRLRAQQEGAGGPKNSAIKP